MNRSNSTLAAGMAALKKLVEQHRSRLVLLVVDDSETDIGLVQQVFHAIQPGHQIDPVTTVTAALQKMTTNQYDFALVDLKMPGANGVDFIRKLRDLGNRTPVVAMSGLENGPLVDEAREAGAIVHIRKTHLESDIRRFLDMLGTL